jgi:ATP-dependent DNA helicase DinG
MRIPPPEESPRLFSANGLLSRTFEGFEYRKQQEAMAAAVASTFLEGRTSLLEAGTGTGKSFAYLIPAVLFSLHRSERVVISTKTINLQEQLMRKDVPFLAEALPAPFKVCLVKGWSNYLCKRRLALIVRRDEGFSIEDFQCLSHITEWARGTTTGDRTELSREPSPTVWERVCCEAASCAFARCPFYRGCFLFNARREMEDANLLVTNHALLFSDVALRKEKEETACILPAFRYAILDEAHHLEEVATEYLGIGLSSGGLARFCNQLFRKESREEGGFLAALRNEAGRLPVSQSVKRELISFIDRDLLGKLIALQERARDFFGVVVDLFFERGSRDERQVDLKSYPRDKEEWRRLREEGRQLHTCLAGMRDGLRELGEGLKLVEETTEDENVRQYQAELAGFARRMKEHGEHLVFLLNRNDEGYVFWLEYAGQRRVPHVQITASPLDVSQVLHDHLFSKISGCVLTSATLSVGKKFDYLCGRTGISILPPEKVDGEMFPSPFDFRRQVLLGVPDDIPEPGDASFCPSLVEPLEKLLAATGGRTFFLFTSYRMLKTFADCMSGGMERIGVTPLVQGEGQRSTLLREFREPGRKALFGTDSFWEGVDVQGEALSCVVIFRLPFRVPTDPVISARYKMLEDQGRPAFKEYAIPQAIIKLKQGFGRLIRSTNDRGVILILDSRILSKWYGKFFLRELPPCRVVKGPLEGIVIEAGKMLKS